MRRPGTSQTYRPNFSLPSLISSQPDPSLKKEAQEAPQGPPARRPFEEFFKEFMERNGQGEQAQRRGISVGSGFVIDAEKGYVVTIYQCDRRGSK